MRVGLTGGIASGKTFVADELRALGAVIIDSDVVAREVVEPGTPGLHAVVQRFGEDVLTADGTLDRAALGEIVFADDAARADLNAIVHPLVRTRAAELQLAAPPGSVVVHVIPLLVETSLDRNFDEIVVVDVSPDEQRRRLIGRDGLTREQADQRLAAQATRQQRLDAATRIIDNSGHRTRTARAVALLWRDLVGGAA